MKERDEEGTEDIHGTEEPWLPIETKLVLASVCTGLATLVVLAILVHIFLLGGSHG